MCYVNPGGNPHLQAVEAEENASAYRTHIVLVRPPSDAGAADESAHRLWHDSFLPSSLTDSGEPRLVHSYTEAFSGFAARLTDAELDAVAKKPGFVRAFPDRTLQLMTTHTLEFLGLRKGPGFWRDVAGYGEGVIVGLLDVGIYGAHPSFADHGVAPPPAKWKGSCAGSASRCNNKLIGVKSLVGDDARDDFGHGTHTSSTAAGNFVAGASRNGMAAGTAVGVAPAAHVAMYKVCTGKGCTNSAVLAGMDAAIKDGVDVISLSLGGNVTFRFDHDPIAIGAFSAVAKGITVVCAAGNNGPKLASVVNDAPWLITVAASSVDRSLPAEVQLGKGVSIAGEAINQVMTNSTTKHLYPVLYSEERRNCTYRGKERRKVAGKIVICEAVDNLLAYNTSEKAILRDIKSAGAAGVVLINTKVDGYTSVLYDYGSDVVQLTAADGARVTKYATSSPSTSFSAVRFYHKTVLGVRPSPTVASFSSRGPSIITPGVLKPDVLAPGLNILAAYPPKTLLGTGPFDFLSGTSMSTPHISGVVALIKSVHPDWSPAAIKSAIMTTSDTVDNNGGPILDEQHRKANAYATGAGHVNPARATDPGLVYDLGAADYASYICALLDEAALAVIARNSSLSCAKLPKTAEAQLNYPTIKVPLQPAPFTVKRTVTNVGPAASTYTAKVDAPKSLTVLVSPGMLVFTKAGEKKTFSVTVSGHDGDVLEGSLSWVSGQHVVRSSIVAAAGHGGY
ncbi:Subtilisin-like protease SBT5.3 [Dichanthelium oligosanthes]|uniref:Subtilisin-like protease SBT5.3 n=1 Tax=Dichanthelium oligosanthes TaxID=888268 RepID=A0A1E5VNG5_9POAL|nr:Subtilisin-like protease SBT5.3 [Dichanthelium oligosanthes]